MVDSMNEDNSLKNGHKMSSSTDKKQGEGGLEYILEIGQDVKREENVDNASSSSSLSFLGRACIPFSWSQDQIKTTNGSATTVSAATTNKNAADHPSTTSWYDLTLQNDPNSTSTIIGKVQVRQSFLKSTDSAFGPFGGSLTWNLLLFVMFFLLGVSFMVMYLILQPPTFSELQPESNSILQKTSELPIQHQNNKERETTDTTASMSQTIRSTSSPASTTSLSSTESRLRLAQSLLHESGDALGAMALCDALLATTKTSGTDSDDVDIQTRQKVLQCAGEARLVTLGHVLPFSAGGSTSISSGRSLSGVSQERLHEAKRLLEHAMQMDPSNAQLRAGVGLTLLALGLLPQQKQEEASPPAPNNVNDKNAQVPSKPSTPQMSQASMANPMMMVMEAVLHFNYASSVKTTSSQMPQSSSSSLSLTKKETESSWLTYACLYNAAVGYLALQRYDQAVHYLLSAMTATTAQNGLPPSSSSSGLQNTKEQLELQQKQEKQQPHRATTIEDQTAALVLGGTLIRMGIPHDAIGILDAAKEHQSCILDATMQKRRMETRKSVEHDALCSALANALGVALESSLVLPNPSISSSSYSQSSASSSSSSLSPLPEEELSWAMVQEQAEAALAQYQEALVWNAENEEAMWNAHYLRVALDERATEEKKEISTA